MPSPASAVSRRSFVRAAGAASLLTAAGWARVAGANERVGVGFIGFGLIGKRHVLDFQSHKDGTISMARDGPDSAMSDFFICVGDQPELDFGGKRNPDGQGFAAFGRVVKGMDVVKKIQASKADGQTLTPPVKIIKVTRKP